MLFPMRAVRNSCILDAALHKTCSNSEEKHSALASPTLSNSLILLIEKDPENPQVNNLFLLGFL